MTTWPRRESPWSPGRLDVMLLVWLLILLAICQRLGPRPPRYQAPAAGVLAYEYPRCGR